MAEIQTPSQPVLIVVGTVAVILILWWLNCHSNPPGESCGKDHEPVYPPPILDITPITPVLPIGCPESYIPSANSWPFPAYIQSPATKSYYDSSFPFLFDAYEPNTVQWSFQPHLQSLYNMGHDYSVDGWMAYSSVPPFNSIQCSYVTKDPTFGDRFYFTQNPSKKKSINSL